MAVEISKFDIHPYVLGTLCYTNRGKKTTVTGPAEHISMFKGKLEFFVYRVFIANTEIIILLLFNTVPY